MKPQKLLRPLSMLIALATILLLFAVTSVSAQPPAPVPVSPAEGSMIVIPTFSWQASSGAEYYEVEVGPQSNPVIVYWSDTTYNLTLTPNLSNPFTNEPLYWRVRAYDSSHTAGPWSSKINFTKNIPAPALSAPANSSTIVEPVLEWQAVEGAAYYKVELSTSATFVPVSYTYTTYNTRLTPTAAIADNNPWYWRVSGVDAGNHVGTPSAGWTFIKNIPAPALISPANGSTIVEPILEWQAVEGAAYYKVELSTSATFVPVSYTYTTYNTRLTPTAAIAHNTPWYWRVSGVDAGNHVGTPSAGWTINKHIPAPALISPDNGSTIVEPVLEWQAVEGAAYYKVELSTSATFVPVSYTYTTYNTCLTPTAAIALNTYYWRVSGVDAEDNVGTPSAGRTFTLNAPPAASDVTPQLLTPANGETLAVDPNFSWTRVVGAADYHLIVSTLPDFSTSYDYGYTDYASFTPYTYGTSGYRNTYVNGTYYWKIEARNASHTVIATSLARSFTKQMNLLLTAPVDGATLTTDPTFQWARVVGARDYHLIVSTQPSFSPSYDYGYTDYVSFTPYTYGTSGYRNTYINGPYYWKIEARDHNGYVITTSLARSFTKQMNLLLTAPADGATLTTDPTFQWARVVGARDYHLIVSTQPSFSPPYDYVYTDYPTFTPYTAGQKTHYSNGTYYWKLEARDHNGYVITTSNGWTFTIGSGYLDSYLPLIIK
jgi:hypothetical protein